MLSTSNIEQIERLSPRSANRRHFYLDPANGDDENDATAAVQGAGIVGPLLTWDETMRRLHWLADGRDVVVNIVNDGLTTTIVTELHQGALPPYVGADPFDITFFPDGFPQFFGRPSFMIRSIPIPVFTPTITGTVAHPVTTLRTIQTSDTFVVDEHKGRFWIGEGLAEYAVIQSNTASDLLVTTSVSSFTNPKIYDVGAELNFGDINNDFFVPSFTLGGVYGSVSMEGIRIKELGLAFAALTIVSSGFPFTCAYCEFEGFNGNAAGLVAMDACYINGSFFGQQGSSLTFRCWKTSMESSRRGSLTCRWSSARRTVSARLPSWPSTRTFPRSTRGRTAGG